MSWWHGDDRVEVSGDLSMVAVPLPDGAALVQEFPGDPILRIEPDGTVRELVPARPEMQLHGVGTLADGVSQVGLLTWWTRYGEVIDERDTQHFGTVDIQSGEVIARDETGFYDYAADHFDMVDSRVLMTHCHILCLLQHFPVDDPDNVEELPGYAPRGAASWWRDGVALIGREDGNDTGNWEELAWWLELEDRTVPMPGFLSGGMLSVAPDESAILVAAGDVATDATTYLVDNLDGTPRVRELSVPGIARFRPTDAER